jgi:hypothetical protein
MIAKILVGLAILVVVLIVVIILQPSDFRITRTAAIAAPPPVVFAQVNDLHKYQAWSPFAKADPAMKITYEGPPAGEGAVLAWAANNKAFKAVGLFMNSDKMVGGMFEEGLANLKAIAEGEAKS